MNRGLDIFERAQRFQRGIGEVRTPQDLNMDYGRAQMFSELNRQFAMNERPNMLASSNYHMLTTPVGADYNINPAQSRHTPPRKSQQYGTSDVNNVGLRLFMAEQGQRKPKRKKKI